MPAMQSALVFFVALILVCRGLICPPAVELGPYGILPWGTLTSFADPTAKWLAAPIGSRVFYYSFKNDKFSKIVGKLHIVGNSIFQVTLNGLSLGRIVGTSNSSSYTKIPVSFPQVEFMFVVRCLNLNFLRALHGTGIIFSTNYCIHKHRLSTRGDVRSNIR